jgi:hypothetical protein
MAKLPIRSLAMSLLCAAAAAAPAQAGSIVLSWDPSQGAAGYHVYYGTTPGDYSGGMITTALTSATITGLDDCTTYYVAVKAFNGAGESPNFSNELSGWSRPTVTSASPSIAMQGDQVVIDVNGANFQGGAVVNFGNPNVFLTSVQVLSCTHIQLLATIEPTSRSIRPAEVGRFDLTVSNPDDVFGLKTQGFEVLINPHRFDVNQSDATTTNRIDGKDTIYVSRQFGQNESSPNYDPDDDFDGDGWVDGNDVAFIAGNLGRCWSAATRSWTLAACPVGMQ